MLEDSIMNEIKINHVIGSEYVHATPPNEIRVEVESQNGRLALIIPTDVVPELRACLERRAPDGHTR